MTVVTVGALTASRGSIIQTVRAKFLLLLRRRIAQCLRASTRTAVCFAVNAITSVVFRLGWTSSSVAVTVSRFILLQRDEARVQFCIPTERTGTFPVCSFYLYKAVCANVLFAAVYSVQKSKVLYGSM